MIEVGDDDQRARQSRPTQRARAVGLEHPARRQHRAARGAGRSAALGLEDGRRRDARSSSRAISAAGRQRRSFFRIWSPLISAFPRPRGTPVLTAEGQRAQARYEGGEQAVADCEVPGMPYAMMSPYPIEIVEQGERLLIRGEAYDLTRVVHLAPPAATPARVAARLVGRAIVGRRARRRDQRHRLPQLRRSRARRKAIRAASSSASSSRPTASRSTTRSPSRTP